MSYVAGVHQPFYPHLSRTLSWRLLVNGAHRAGGTSDRPEVTVANLRPAAAEPRRHRLSPAWLLVAFLLWVIYAMPETVETGGTLPGPLPAAPSAFVRPHATVAIPHRALPLGAPMIATAPPADIQSISTWLGENKLDLALQDGKMTGYLGFTPVRWDYSNGRITGTVRQQPVTLAVANGRLAGEIGGQPVAATLENTRF